MRLHDSSTASRVLVRPVLVALGLAIPGLLPVMYLAAIFFGNVDGVATHILLSALSFVALGLVGGGIANTSFVISQDWVRSGWPRSRRLTATDVTDVHRVEAARQATDVVATLHDGSSYRIVTLPLQYGLGPRAARRANIAIDRIRRTLVPAAPPKK